MRKFSYILATNICMLHTAPNNYYYLYNTECALIHNGCVGGANSNLVLVQQKPLNIGSKQGRVKANLV